MFGPASYMDAPIEMCYSNCPRIYPMQDPAGGALAAADANASQLRQLPVEYQTEAGRRIYPDRAKPCYLMVRLARPHCRALRNFIIANTSKLAVVKAHYCGIATKVLNMKSDSLEPNLSIGLLKFSSTHQALRFVTDETKMLKSEFLGGRYDVWNLTMLAPDRCIVPNPAHPSKFVNSMNVFHLVHIQGLAHVREGAEISPAARDSALLVSAAIQARMEASLDTVERHAGRLVVKATTASRIRGLPHLSPAGEPRHAVYMSQWPGVHQFWQWLESSDGLSFGQSLTELSGTSYESFLFTACLDFVDLV